ncbi:hypothetical protein GCM10029964_055720 [Kibdelosporangium lantanae]
MTETATTSGMLTGKVVIVTGASTGIGAASAVLFAREGATVVLAARTEDKLGKVTAEITGEGGQASYVVCDVSDAASVRNLVDITVERHGRLDGAFNNAGVLTPAQTPLADVPEAEFDELFAINVKGLWLAMRAEIPAILAGGGSGAIVNMSSLGGLRGAPGEHVQRDQARRDRPDQVRGARLRPARYPGQRSRARGDRHRGHARGQGKHARVVHQP